MDGTPELVLDVADEERRVGEARGGGGGHGPWVAVWGEWRENRMRGSWDGVKSLERKAGG